MNRLAHTVTSLAAVATAARLEVAAPHGAPCWDRRRSLLHEEGLGAPGEDALLLQLLCLAGQDVLVVLHGDLRAPADTNRLQRLRLVLSEVFVTALELQHHII